MSLDPFPFSENCFYIHAHVLHMICYSSRNGSCLENWDLRTAASYLRMSTSSAAVFFSEGLVCHITILPVWLSHFLKFLKLLAVVRFIHQHQSKLRFLDGIIWKKAG